MINKYCKNNFDTGSSEIQIILITFKILNINNYLKKNRDIFCNRSLVKLLSKRNKLLNYLKKKKYKIYLNLLKDLNL
ncbi:30S ribosomal protein S15p (S13e) [Candidatus Nasuia deltocephalinicola]|nr:30S ribosomal protein S15p (S13e) [Candidatus Nasuia deltocephalinicola]